MPRVASCCTRLEVRDQLDNEIVLVARGLGTVLAGENEELTDQDRNSKDREAAPEELLFNAMREGNDRLE